MREIRLHGSEGGEAEAFPTPIQFQDSHWNGRRPPSRGVASAAPGAHAEVTRSRLTPTGG